MTTLKVKVKLVLGRDFFRFKGISLTQQGEVVNSRSGYAVEAGASSQGVGSHVLEVEPISIIQLWHLVVFDDAVQTVAGRTPDAGLELAGPRLTNP